MKPSSAACSTQTLAAILLALLALQLVDSLCWAHQPEAVARAPQQIQQSQQHQHHYTQPLGGDYYNYSQSQLSCCQNLDDQIGLHQNISANQHHTNRLLSGKNLTDNNNNNNQRASLRPGEARGATEAAARDHGQFCATAAQLAAVAASGRSQEAAVGATVNLVRLILVILICVLLVKLRHPKSVGGGGGKSSADSSARGDAQHSNGTSSSSGKQANDPQEGNRCDECTSAALLRKESSTLNRWMMDSGKTFDSRNLINLTANYFSSATSAVMSRRRRNSQPDLTTKPEVVPGAPAHERKRRHSDTCLAHLSLPPGPMGLPFLGYLPFVGHEIHLTLTSLSERYGPIYQIFLGGIRVVVLNDAALVRQAFKQPVFSGRPDTQLTRILQGYGIVNSDGALWKEQRAFLHSALRKLGAKSLMSGSNGLEAKIQNQVKEFVNDLSVHASQGKPCQVRPIVARAVSSVVGSIVMNLTYRKYEEKEKFDRLIELMQEGFRLFTIAMPLDFIPIFRFLPGVSYAYKKMQRNRAETSAFFQGVADEHRKYLSETFNLSAASSQPGDAGNARRQPLHPRSGNGTSGGGGRLLLPPASALNSSAQASVDTSLGAGEPADQLQLQGQAGRAASSELATVSGRPQQQQHPERQQQQQQQQKESSQGQGAAERLVGGQPTALTSNGNPNGETATATPPATTTADQLAGQKRHVELENIVARDLVDAYLVQQRKHEKDGKENYFSDQQLVQIMSDIFSAGLETVTSTIEWSILFLILNPDCQAKIHEEIEQMIGSERAPQLDDLSQMPYTEATIYEVLRRSNVIALGNAHATLADATIAGYRIPKGTQVLPNLYGIHMNPQLWNEPQRFDPSRFIVNDKAQKPDYFIPFSVGRRMCLGDVLAKMEVFLFLVGLLQKYELTVAEEDRDNPPQVKGTIGVSNTPASFRVALKHRQNRNHHQS